MRFTAIAIWLMLLPLMVSAHHSRAGYVDEPIELEGELVDVIWRNPHVGFVLSVSNENGEEELWEIEGFGSIYALQRTGITEDLFKAGAPVVMFGLVTPNRSRHFLASHVLLPDGTETVLQANAEPHWSGRTLGGRLQWVADEAEAVDAAEDNRGIFRVWSIPALADRVLHVPFTDAAIASRATWDALNNFTSRCEPEGMPRVMINPHPFEFVDRGDTIQLRVELYDQERAIHMNGSIPEDAPASRLGYSAGHWEGSELVVETTRVNWPYFDNIGTRQGENVLMVERFRLSDDQRRLDYHLTVTDSGTFTEPATITGHWLALGEAIAPYECEVS